MNNLNHLEDDFDIRKDPFYNEDIEERNDFFDDIDHNEDRTYDDEFEIIDEEE